VTWGNTINRLFAIGRAPAADYLVIESTYGSSARHQAPKEALERIIKDAAARGGAVLIPAFAVGRAQELLYFIRELEDEKRIPVLPVCLDSPMAAAATQAYARRTDEHDAEYADALKTTPTPLSHSFHVACSTRDESKRVQRHAGARASSSRRRNMNGGRVLHHALRLLPMRMRQLCSSAIRLGHIGRRVADGEKQVKVLGQWVPGEVPDRKNWRLLGACRLEGSCPLVGGHAVAAASRVSSRTESRPAQAMAAHIRDRFGWTVEVPQYGERFELI